MAAPATFDGQKLAKQVVAAYREQYGDKDATTMAAIDLSQLNAVSEQLNHFADLAVAALPAHAADFKAARAACKNYAPGFPLNSIDLVHFLQTVATHGALNANLRAAATQAAAAVKAAVADSYASVKRQGNYGSNGLAIDFPISKLAFRHDPDHEGYLTTNTKFPVEFVQTQRWVKFLNAYLAAVG